MTTALARPEYRVVIVGGGIVGLWCAVHLARRGAGPILTVDRSYLSGGASGRNGGGLRQQWESPLTVRLAREAIHQYRRFGRDFGYNVWFRPGGYLFLAETDAEVAELDRVAKVVRGEGLPIQRLDREQVRAIAPALRVDGVRSASFLASDGTAYPFPALWGLFEAARSLGVELAYGTEVTGVDPLPGGRLAVATSRGTVRAGAVLNAAGGWSADVAALARAPIPNRATRHEILATEAVKPFLDPMVVRLRDGLYFSQTMRGEIVGGLTVPHPPGTAAGMPSSPEFLARMARAIVGLVPRLGPVGILRAWAGFYDETPDGMPNLGPDPRRPGLFHANGFGGHGFMLAPATSLRAAQLLLGDRVDFDPALVSVGRHAATGPGPATERLTLG